MKLQVFEHCTPSRSFPTRPQTCCSVTIIMLLALLLTASSRTLIAQENFLVATQDGTFSLYDLATTSLLETFQSSPSFTPSPPDRTQGWLIRQAEAAMVWP